MSVEQQKKDVLLRLKKIEGQIRGLQRMVEEEAGCPEIMMQVAAVTAAIKKVGTVVIQAYMEECLNQTARQPVSRRAETLRDLQKAISQYIDRA